MSFKLIDKIKKSNLPAPLKRVLEAYVSFGNSDGTNIRPTADAVADRITGSRTTVARYTPKLVRLGLLIHDRNEDGTCKTHSYNSTGTWAYVYHADLSPLSRTEIAAGFEMSRQAISQKRQAAGRKGGRPKLQMELFDESNLLQTSQSNLLQTGQTNLQQTEESKLQHGPDPSTTQTQTYPSAVSTAVSDKVTEETSSLASLASEDVAENLKTENLTGVGDLADQNQEPQEVLHAMVPVIEGVWRKRTQRPFTDEERRLASYLCIDHGYRLVEAVLHSTLNVRPKSAKMCWTRFEVFYDNWETNHDLYLADIAAFNADRKNGYSKPVVTKFDPAEPLSESDVASMEAHFKAHNKIDNWSMSGAEREALGFTKAQQQAVVRWVVENCMGVTKERFLELLHESVGVSYKAVSA